MNEVRKMPLTNVIANYEAMTYAIAECVRVDEVKDLRDKAMALQLYHKQARNLEAERQACNIRLRAERRVGQLLAEMTRTTPAEAGKSGGKAFGNIKTSISNDGTCLISDHQSEFAEALTNNNISRQTAHRYQALAAVPDEVMEAALADPTGEASASSILRSVSEPKVKPMPNDALWIWGLLRDMERQNYFDKNITDLLSPHTETMKADMHRLAPLAADFFTQLNEVLNEHP
jgi:hypothetical protein